MPAKKAKKTKTSKKSKKQVKDKEEKKVKETIKVKDIKPAPTESTSDSTPPGEVIPEKKEDEVSEEVTTEDKPTEDKPTEDKPREEEKKDEVLDFTKPLTNKKEEPFEEEDKSDALASSLETEKLDDQKSKKLTSFRQLDSDIKTEKESKFESKPEDVPSKKEIKTDVLSDTTKDATTVENEPEKTSEKEEAAEKKESVSSDEVKKWLQDVRPDKTKELEKKSKPNIKLIFTIAVILLLFGVLIGGVFYYKSRVENVDTTQKEETSDTSSVSSPTPTQTPTPEEEAEIDLSEYSLNVLNGSGIAGEAGKVSKMLEDAGFTSPTAGNAGSYDFTTTVVSLKENVPDEVYEKIQKSLETDYIVEKSDDKLDEDFEYDIKIVVGSKKAE